MRISSLDCAMYEYQGFPCEFRHLLGCQMEDVDWQSETLEWSYYRWVIPFTSSSSLGLVEAIFSKLIIPALTSALDSIGPEVHSAHMLYTTL